MNSQELGLCRLLPLSLTKVGLYLTPDFGPTRDSAIIIYIYGALTPRFTKTFLPDAKEMNEF